MKLRSKKHLEHHSPGYFTLITPTGDAYKIESYQEMLSCATKLATEFYQKNPNLSKSKKGQVRKTREGREFLRVELNGMITVKKVLFSPEPMPKGDHLPPNLYAIYLEYINKHPMRMP